jgi:zinc protease
MKRILMMIAALSLLAACGQNAKPRDEQAAGGGGLAIAPLKFKERALANGLRVYAMPDPDTANVSVHVWYNVGSKDDPAGRSGFAHLFEHIMFKATKNMPTEFLDRLTEDVGGFNNASTYDDFTNYYEVVPANHLERILWAEAERMGSLVVDEATFDSERDVVKEELRQRILASPYGRLFGLYISQANFSVHPYGRPGIGSIEDLDAATVDDVRAFHAAYYRPDNAVLVVAGNFKEKDLDRWVDKYFADIVSPTREIPRVTAVEPKRTAPRDLTAYAPNVPLPAILVSYPQFAAKSPDLAALRVLDAIVSRGESSRLYQALVYEQQVAAEVFTNLEATQDPGAYSFGVILSDGKTIDEGLQSLLAEIARLRDTAPSAAELDEAKNEIVTETLEGRETAFGRAFELAESVIRYGDPGYADALLDAVQNVTVGDVQRVAQDLFNDEARVVVRYLSEDARPEGATGDVIATSPAIVAQQLDIPTAEIPIFNLAPEGERASPPAPGDAVSPRIPATSEKTLANGLRVIVASARALPLLSANLRVAAGGSADPQGRAGLADLSAELLTKGTATRSAVEIAREIESLGASLDAGADADSSALSLQTRSDRANEAFAVFADVAKNPVFADDEMERARQQALDELSVALRQPGGIAARALARLVYGAAPYGGVSSPASLEALTPAGAKSFHAAHWRPDNAVLVIAGDVAPEEGFALAARFFGDWAKPAGAAPAAPDATAFAPAPRTVVIDLPDSGQAAVYYGMRAVARTDADYFPAAVATNVLGGGYSARLNTEIRIKRGLSYGASARLAQQLAPAPIVASAQTRNDAAVEVVGLMEAEFARLRSEPVAEGELVARKAVIIGGFGRSVETTAGLAGQITNLALFNLSPEELKSFASDFETVTAEDVRGVAARFLDPAKASLVVVGDAKVFIDGLKAKKPNAELIPIDALNLDSETLR